MIISEKQILQLMQVSALYLETIKEISSKNIDLSPSAMTNKKNVKLLLKEIINQQSDELKEVE